MSDSQQNTPYWRLSGFYLFYFASLGAFLPYWAVYLKSLRFTPQEIGELIAVVMATKILSPNIWGWIADHTGRRMAIVRMGSLLALLCFAGVFISHSYWWLVLVMLAYSFFWNAALPQFEATTFTHLGDHSHRYSNIRLWGSIGFIVSVSALGPVLDYLGAGLLPTIFLLLLGGIWIVSLSVPEQSAGYFQLDHEPLLQVLKRPEVVSLLLVCFLMQASHGPYYTFYTIYMESNGYSRGLVGQLWALGVVAEVGIFLLMQNLVIRYGLRKLLLASLALATIRWLLIGFFVQDLPVMIFAQTLHAASFGVYHASAIQLIHQFFTGRHQGKGQALYSSMSFGAGGALGSLFSGYTWDTAGASITFAIAALFSLTGFAVAWFGIKQRHTVSTA
jgi:PPP family 3-phenylpropionic acid transporter